MNSIDYTTEKPTASDATSEETGPYVEELFEQLRIARKTVAEIEKLPAYIIFHNRVLQEMATQLPQSVEAFGQISGVGPAKIKKYAAVFLPIICNYCLPRHCAYIS